MYIDEWVSKHQRKSVCVCPYVGSNVPVHVPQWNDSVQIIIWFKKFSCGPSYKTVVKVRGYDYVRVNNQASGWRSTDALLQVRCVNNAHRFTKRQVWTSPCSSWTNPIFFDFFLLVVVVFFHIHSIYIILVRRHTPYTIFCRLFFHQTRRLRTTCLMSISTALKYLRPEIPIPIKTCKSIPSVGLIKFSTSLYW